VTGANAQDVTQLELLVEAILLVLGRRGRPPLPPRPNNLTSFPFIAQINKINAVDFNNLDGLQYFGDIYEQLLNDL